MVISLTPSTAGFENEAPLLLHRAWPLQRFPREALAKMYRAFGSPFGRLKMGALLQKRLAGHSHLTAVDGIIGRQKAEDQHGRGRREHEIGED